MRKISFVIVAVLTATSIARADRPRYARKQHLDLDVKLSERAKPSGPSTAPAPKPAITAEAVMMIEDRAQPLRLAQEAKLVELVEKTPDDDPEKPDLLFRLAEHYAQQLGFWRLKAVGATIPTRARNHR